MGGGMGPEGSIRDAILELSLGRVAPLGKPGGEALQTVRPEGQRVRGRSSRSSYLRNTCYGSSPLPPLLCTNPLDGHMGIPTAGIPKLLKVVFYTISILGEVQFI